MATVGNIESARMEGKVTLVTGGCGGIGKATVDVFLKNSSTVAFCDITDDVGAKLEAEWNALYPGRVLYVHCDITDEDEIQKLISAVIDKFGHLDCVVNIAGAYPGQGSIDDWSSDAFRKLLALNVTGQFMVTKHALPHLRKVKGNIVNMSSILSVHGEGKGLLYSASKGALSSMTKALALDEGVNGVRVNAVCPAITSTPLIQSWVNMHDNPETFKKKAESFLSLRRFAEPEEIGRACLFLASEGTFCTGIELYTSAGQELGYRAKVH